MFGRSITTAAAVAVPSPGAIDGTRHDDELDAETLGRAVREPAGAA
jgi:hypothetical protein